MSLQVVLQQVTFAVQAQQCERKHRHACIVGPNLQYPSIVEAICATQLHLCSEAPGPHMMRSTGLQVHHGLQSNHHACWLTATCNTEASGVCLQQGRSFICNSHLPSEALSCQCKWYLGRSPLLRMTPGNTIVHAGSDLICKTSWLRLLLLCSKVHPSYANAS